MFVASVFSEMALVVLLGYSLAAWTKLHVSSVSSSRCHAMTIRSFGVALH